MFNLLSGEWYKIRKSKSFFVCTLIAIGLVLLLYGAARMVEEGGSVAIELEIENTYEDESGASLDAGYASSTQAESAPEESEVKIGIMDIMELMLGGFVQIIACIFVCIFVVEEYGNGAIKNFTGKGYTRRQIFQSKYVASLMAAVWMCIISVAATVILGICFTGVDELNVEFFKNLFIYVTIQIVLEIALTGIIVVISEISRNMGTTIAISMVLIMFSTAFSGMLDLLFRRFDFKVSDYWIVDLIENCPNTNVDGTFLRHMVIACIIWIVASLFIGTKHFQKRDVN